MSALPHPSTGQVAHGFAVLAQKIAQTRLTYRMSTIVTLGQMLSMRPLHWATESSVVPRSLMKAIIGPPLVGMNCSFRP